MKEILLMSYWEHFKRAKELALIFSPEYPQRVKVQQAIDELQAKLNKQ